MITVISILILTSLMLISSILFFPKIKIKRISLNTYWIVCVIGAMLCFIFNCVSINEVIDGLFKDSIMNPIKILLLFFSMTFLSIFLDEVGFFHYLAVNLTKRFKSNQKMLFLTLYVMVAILTIFTSNDIVILTFTPFICYFSKNAKINPIPYLIAEFAAANTYSMMLIIGNPTNIYLGTAAGIDFISYVKVMALPTVLAGLTEILLIYILFRKQLKAPLNLEVNEEKIKDKVSLIIGLLHLIVCLIMLTISSYIALDMWLICLFCALTLIVCITVYYLIKKKKFIELFNTTKRLPWDLIPFVISMFIIVLSLNNSGVTEVLRNFLGEKNVVFSYGYSSFLACNLINNIPMSVLFSTIPNMPSSLLQQQAIYSTVIGSNIGAFLTPIGALAGIMFTDLVNKQNVSYSFKTFVKYGVIIALPTITVALLGLLIVL